MMILSSTPVYGGEEDYANTKIFVLTDIHYLAKSLHDEGKAFKRLVYEGDGKNTELIHEILEAFRFSLQEEKPDILLVTGDLTLNGEKASHTALASWFEELESLGIKVFVLPGNHDISNPWARKFSRDHQYPIESVTPEEFNTIYRAFGFDEAIVRDKESLSYVVEPVPGLRIFMLDSCFYADNTLLGYPEAGGGFAEGTLAWIRMNLSKARESGGRALVAMHHNVVDHNPFISDEYTIYDAESVLDSFVEADVPLVLTGHVHVQDISVASTPHGQFYDIATNSLSVFPHNFGKLLYSPRLKSFSYRTAPVDVESWAQEKKVTDDRLINFRAYAESFFRDRSAFMVSRMLARMETPLPRKRKSALQEIFGTLNARFFAGKASLNVFDIANSEVYKDLIAADFGFLSSYAQSIVDDPSPENNELDISF